jgi:hypothetical protein
MPNMGAPWRSLIAEKIISSIRRPCCNSEVILAYVYLSVPLNFTLKP